MEDFHTFHWYLNGTDYINALISKEPKNQKHEKKSTYITIRGGRVVHYSPRALFR